MFCNPKKQTIPGNHFRPPGIVHTSSSSNINIFCIFFLNYFVKRCFIYCFYKTILSHNIFFSSSMETRWFQYICSVKSFSGFFIFLLSFPYTDYITNLPSITFIDINRHSLLHILHLLSLLFPKTQGTVTIAQFDI